MGVCSVASAGFWKGMVIKMQKKEWLKNLVFLVPSVCIAVCAGWGLHLAANVVLPKAEAIVREQIEKDKEQTQVPEQQEQKPVEKVKVKSSKWKDGSYTGSARGYGGNIVVKITVRKGKMTAIEVVSHAGETESFYEKAKGIISKILSAQSVDVDTVSGATYSSNGIRNAVAEALRKAGDKQAKAVVTTAKKQSDTAPQKTEHRKTVKGQPSDGVYSGSAVCTRFGYTVRLKAKFKGGKLVALYDMKMLGNTDSANVSYMKRAWREMVKRLLKQQSDQVDTVSGATYSSQTIVQAYLDAYEKAVKHTTKSDQKKNTTKVEKTPAPIKVPSASSVPSENIVDGSYQVSAVCEPDEDEAFESYTLRAVVTFYKGKCVKITGLTSDRESNRPYYKKAALGTKGAAGVVQQVIKKQSAQGIQAVSGATCSSKAIVQLYYHALLQAAKQTADNVTPTPQPTEVPVTTPIPTETPKVDDIVLIPLKSGSYPQSVLVEPNEERAFEEYTISADVVFAENRFAGFENVVLSDESNRWYYTRALNGTKKKKGLLTQIQEKENDQLDVVSGATCTSKALIEMYAKAWKEAKE